MVMLKWGCMVNVIIAETEMEASVLYSDIYQHFNSIIMLKCDAVFVVCNLNTLNDGIIFYNHSLVVDDVDLKCYLFV